jgi:hypothetical protein
LLLVFFPSVFLRGAISFFLVWWSFCLGLVTPGDGSWISCSLFLLISCSCSCWMFLTAHVSRCEGLLVCANHLSLLLSYPFRLVAFCRSLVCLVPWILWSTRGLVLWWAIFYRSDGLIVLFATSNFRLLVQDHSYGLHYCNGRWYSLLG